MLLSDVPTVLSGYSRSSMSGGNRQGCLGVPMASERVWALREDFPEKVISSGRSWDWLGSEQTRGLEGTQEGGWQGHRKPCVQAGSLREQGELCEPDGPG